MNRKSNQSINELFNHYNITSAMTLHVEKTYKKLFVPTFLVDFLQAAV